MAEAVTIAAMRPEPVNRRGSLEQQAPNKARLPFFKQRELERKLGCPPICHFRAGSSAEVGCWASRREKPLKLLCRIRRPALPHASRETTLDLDCFLRQRNRAPCAASASGRLASEAN